MKKISYILILLVAFIPLMFIKADEVDYTIKSYYIDSEIDVAGSLNVKELLVLNGKYNGYQRDIVIKGGTDWELHGVDYRGDSSIYSGYSIENLQVYGKKLKNYKEASFEMMNPKEFSDFTKVSFASNGAEKKYIVYDNTDGASVRMYNKSSGGTYAFLITYTVTNVTVIHNDCAEVYWNFIGDSFADKLENVKIRLRLPDSDNSDNFRIWAHGPITGEVNILSDKDDNNIGLVATIPKVSRYTPIDVRMTFDPSIIKVSNFLKHSNEDAVEEILAVEKQRADEYNNKRLIAKIVNIAFIIFDLVYFIILVITWIVIYFTLDKEYKSEFNLPYYRDFLDNYEPEELNYLINHNINYNSFSASFMNLIYRKKIEILPGEKENDYTFKLINSEALTEPEALLISLMFADVGGGDTFSLKQLKKYTKNQTTGPKFARKYAIWSNAVTRSAKKKKVYEPFHFTRAICIIFAIIAIIINWFALVMEIAIPIALFLGILSIAFILYCALFTKRTRSGNDDYRKAMASKKFLSDFGTFPEKDLPEIKLWDKYMVYATAFGIASKVEKSMSKHLKAMNVSDVYNNGDFVFINIGDGITSSLSNSLSSGLSSAVASSVSSAVASSVASSASGGGGGFSSGGGHGGGGGGGHGF